ncbi:uncharacterized protein NDAI_0D00960 [Naumovozyma dairenensis CBS 421]|uniref:Uncharacterized protein n=1 Tax=Naumovozyma dairenensis (strain ATCC 10597 / BCRC 20456 / CBS 421 / NBRC 0211 / NRRL Y-12639) TaxID=1071378 RepID=G0W9E9_NAUDC|nr:hypothetical protein NDAI_0D00960 [Naumovozyma dairenensis CBS 421]CCD24410.1 hypothetical protein NDAI_0D00960 [Naumovozyma dairenensis CBS 421]
MSETKEETPSMLHVDSTAVYSSSSTPSNNKQKEQMLELENILIREEEKVNANDDAINLPELTEDKQQVNIKKQESSSEEVVTTNITSKDIETFTDCTETGETQKHRPSRRFDTKKNETGKKIVSGRWKISKVTKEKNGSSSSNNKKLKRRN